MRPADSSERRARGVNGPRALQIAAAVALVVGVGTLRLDHGHWLSRDPAHRTYWIGLFARLAVLLGGLAIARTFAERGANGPALPSAWGAIRGGFYLHVLFVAALCLSPYEWRVARAWGAAGAGLFAAGVGLHAVMASRTPRLLRALDVGLANLCLTAVGLELGLTVLASVSPSPLLTLEADARGRPRWEEVRLEPGAEHLGVSTNEWGDVDDPPRAFAEEGCSVVMIGDSFSVGIVPRPYHFSSVAEAEGECAIYNMGAPSIGPVEYLYLLTTRAPLLSADASIVNLYLFNDVWDVERSPVRRAPWLSRERRRVYRIGERIVRAWLARDAPLVRGPGTTDRRLSLEERFPEVLDPTLERPTIPEEAYLDIQVHNAQSVLTDSDEYWPEFFAVLEAMIAATGGEILFMLIPGEPQVEDDVWAQVEGRSPIPMTRDAAQRRTIEWLEARGVRYLDLLPALLEVEPLEDGRRHVFHAQDTHLNARGNRVVGIELARFLSEQVQP